MKLFLSWSGELSARLATVLHKWIPYIIQPVRPFMSSLDISKGERWGGVLREELKEAQYSIICVTPHSLWSRWMHFEAGVLSKFIDQSAVTPLLFNVDRSALEGTALSQFQSTMYGNEEECRSLIYSINKRLGDAQVDREIVRREFDVWWKELKNEINPILNELDRATHTPYEWLYTTDDFRDYEAKATYKSAWIITPNIYNFALEANVRKIVENNLRNNNVKYRYFVPDEGCAEATEMTELNLMAVQTGNLECRAFEHSDFETHAATDYVIFNVDDENRADEKLLMFLRLPLAGKDGEFWAKLDDRSANAFKNRFRDLWPRGRVVVGKTDRPESLPARKLSAQAGGATE
jgi:hypothetical protein